MLVYLLENMDMMQVSIYRISHSLADRWIAIQSRIAGWLPRHWARGRTLSGSVSPANAVSNSLGRPTKKWNKCVSVLCSQQSHTYLKEYIFQQLYVKFPVGLSPRFYKIGGFVRWYLAKIRRHWRVGQVSSPSGIKFCTTNVIWADVQVRIFIIYLAFDHLFHKPCRLGIVHVFLGVSFAMLSRPVCSRLPMILCAVWINQKSCDPGGFITGREGREPLKHNY